MTITNEPSGSNGQEKPEVANISNMPHAQNARGAENGPSGSNGSSTSGALDAAGAVKPVPAGHPERPEGADGARLLERMNGGHHEDLALWGMAQLKIAPNAHMLDIGCGGGANIARLLSRAPRGHVRGLDYSPLSVATSREHNRDAIAAGRCEVVEGDSGALPFEDGIFDIATAFETVYYWDIETAFAEVARVLRPGGQFLICNEDDGRDPAMVEFAKQVPNMTMHTPEALEAALRVAGFERCTLAERPGGDFALIAHR